MSQIQGQEANDYLQTEFFFYFLPSYYAILAFIFRYYRIMKEPIHKNCPRIPGQSIVLWLEDQPTPNTTPESPPPSYEIKLKLCLLNGWIYVLMTVLGLLATENMFYVCKHKQYSPIYLLGFISWSLAAIVLRREYQRELPQSLWTHRFFWIFSGTFAITKMFEDYLLPMNFIINSISLASNLILIVYALYRPEDKSILALLHHEDTPSCVKWFFSSFELNSWVRRVFRIKDELVPELDGKLNEELDEEEIKEISESLKISPKVMREEINLLNTLPRRNIFVDKKLRYIKNEFGIFKYYYFIFTQIGNSRFEVQRTYLEFEQLFFKMISVFNEQNFPSLTLPALPKSEESSNLFQELENWLSQIVKKPIFMIKPFLEFLNIDEESSNPFLTYYDVAYHSFCSKTYVVEILKRKKEERHVPSRIGYFEETKEGINKKIVNSIKQKYKYEVSVNSDSTSAQNYCFWITATPENEELEKHKWKILKKEEDIYQLNPQIEEECRTSVSFYYQLVSMCQGKPYQEKAEKYMEYLQRLLNNEKYYCLALFSFIKFDPIHREVRLISRHEISSTHLQQDQRLSHYMEEYEDQGNFIEVLRVDRLEKYRFQLRIRRGGFTLKKNSQKVEEMRNQLAKIYKGVSYVPEITYKNSNKRQAKERTETFLSKIESLPKISINQCYLSFYEHSI